MVISARKYDKPGRPVQRARIYIYTLGGVGLEINRYIIYLNSYICDLIYINYFILVHLFLHSVNSS